MHKAWNVFLALAAVSLSAQSARDVAPLNNWPAPLYWQPSRVEAENIARSGIRGASGELAPRAQTPANSLVFVAMTPCRVVDTRSGSGFTGAFGPPSLVGGATRNFPPLSQSACSIPPTAEAYSFNVTVVPPGPLGFLTIWPGPISNPLPLASTLNDLLGTVVANAAIVPAGMDGGSVNVFASNNTDLMIDINGYYAPQSGITLMQGSAGAPSLSFGGDSGTGIYSSGPGAFNVTAGGLSALSVGGISQNTAVGVSALLNTTSGINNTAVGYQAMAANTSGYANTATGNASLHQNATGFSNTADGEAALFLNTTGSNNTAEGAGALSNNTTGSNNVALGSSALFINTTGSNNISIGAGAARNISAGNNNIHIGSQGASADNGAIRIGTAGTQTSFYVAGVNGVTTTNSAVPVLIDTTTGQLGVTSSSRRYKEDIQDMGEASHDLMRLRPVTFRYQKPFADGFKPIQYGLIAEEVDEVYPDLVAHSADGQIETVKYQVLDSMLLNEVQRLDRENRGLEARLAQLEAELKSLSVEHGSH